MTDSVRVPLVEGSATSVLNTPYTAGEFNFRAIYISDNTYLRLSNLPLSEPLHVDEARLSNTVYLGIDCP